MQHSGTQQEGSRRLDDAGLYDPAFEHDSCGFGVIANVDGKASAWLVDQAFVTLARMSHRGGIGADGITGDGCGMLLYRPTAWLRALLELDPRGPYPLFAAARVYAEIRDPARSRLMLEFVYEQFLLDPNRRWPWLAHAALLAKHRLHDLPLARRYAAAIDRHTTAADVPLWARQMEIFILEDMNEIEAARIMLGGLLASGKITDPAEAAFLKQRLEALGQRR